MLRKIFSSKLFKAGLILFTVGISPLLLYVLYEFVTGTKGGNPIGPGLLFVVTSGPGVILMAVGIVLALLKKDTATPQ